MAAVSVDHRFVELRHGGRKMLRIYDRTQVRERSLADGTGGTASSIGQGTLTNLGSIVNPQHFSSTVTQFDESVIYTHGRHVIKAGFQLQKYNLNVFYPGNAGELGAEVFGLGAGGNYSGNGTGGDPSADFALGLPESVGRGISSGGWHARDWLIAGFVQDDWRVTNNL